MSESTSVGIDGDSSFQPISHSSTMPAVIADRAGAVPMTYPGGKNAAGVAQRIINQMPPHRVYIEPFLGSGAVLRQKKRAERSIGIDRSPKAIALCMEIVKSSEGLSLFEDDALALLPNLAGMLDETPFIDRHDTLIYADPPYLPETRRGGDLYDFELSHEDHERLFDVLTSCACMVMISGYRSALYDDRLRNFRRIDYQAQTRRGFVTESLWMNFPQPSRLHDYSFLGDTYRERERIKRKRARWKAKFAQLAPHERLAILEDLSGDWWL